MSRRATAGWRLWGRRLVVAATIAAAAHLALAAFREARSTWRQAHRLRGESFASAQERRLGADYMAALREMRSRVGVEETVYLVDAQSREFGAPYFVLHYLAPRRVERIGSTRDRSLRRLLNRVPPHGWVVVVGDPGRLPRLERRERLRGETRRAG